MVLYRDDKGEGFGDMKSWIEFKLEYDPFQDDNPNAFIRDSLPAKSIVGQLVSYGAAHMGSSFRMHSLSVLVFGNMARLIRWDRAGEVVSKSFDYTETNHLVDFLGRFDRLTPEQRGTDMFVTVLADVEAEAERAALRKETSHRSQEFENGKLLKFAVPPDEGVKHLVGWVPSDQQQSMVGRKFRGAPVYVKKGNIRWLKDTRSPYAEGLDTEVNRMRLCTTNKSAISWGLLLPVICALPQHPTTPMSRAALPWDLYKPRSQIQSSKKSGITEIRRG